MSGGPRSLGVLRGAVVPIQDRPPGSAARRSGTGSACGTTSARTLRDRRSGDAVIRSRFFLHPVRSSFGDWVTAAAGSGSRGPDRSGKSTHTKGPDPQTGRHASGFLQGDSVGCGASWRTCLGDSRSLKAAKVQVRTPHGMGRPQSRCATAAPLPGLIVRPA